MEFSFCTVIMSESLESSLPSYSKMKEEYPERTEMIEESMTLHAQGEDFENILSKSVVPEIISEAEGLDYQELVSEYDQSLVFELIDYGLLDHDLDGLRVSPGGEDYLELIDDMRDENTDNPEYLDLDIDEKDLWTPETELENHFSRYYKDLDTMRNVFEGRDDHEDHIRWNELPEVSDNFPEEPEWYSNRSSNQSKGPDWVNN